MWILPRGIQPKSHLKRKTKSNQVASTSRNLNHKDHWAKSKQVLKHTAHFHLLGTWWKGRNSNTLYWEANGFAPKTFGTKLNNKNPMLPNAMCVILDSQWMAKLYLRHLAKLYFAYNAIGSHNKYLSTCHRRYELLKIITRHCLNVWVPKLIEMDESFFWDSLTKQSTKVGKWDYRNASLLSQRLETAHMLGFLYMRHTERCYFITLSSASHLRRKWNE